MGEVQQREVQSTFTAVDKSSVVLAKIEASTSKVASSVDKLSTGLAGLAGLAAAGAGAFGISSAVHATMEHLGNVKRIVNLTGMAAERADGLAEAMARVGIGGDEAARYMLLVSKAGAKMEMALAGGSANAATLNGWLKQMGVDVKHGPEATFMGLASAMKKGRLELTDLMLRFRIPMSAAADMAKFLKQGPEKIRSTIDEIAKSGMAVTPETLKTYSDIKEITRGISTTWERIQIVVASKLLPVISELLEDGEHKLEGWLDRAATFGEVMGSFLRDHLHLVTQIGKVLLANAAIAKLTGTGVIGNAMKGLGWMRGEGPLVKARTFRDVLPKAPVFASVLDGTWKNGRYTGGEGKLLDAGFSFMAPTRAQRLRNSFEDVYRGAARFTPVLGMFARVIGLSGGLLLVAGAFQGITDAMSGKTTYAANKWREAMGYMSGMGIEVENIFGPQGTFMEFFANTAAWLASMTAKYSAKSSDWIAERWLARKELGKAGGKTLLGMNWEQWKWDLTLGHTAMGKQALEHQRQMTEEINKHDRAAFNVRMAKKQAEQQTETPGARARNYVDMRYSKFEITNKFAEGYDAERIAVGFVQKLASMGERRLQSGLAPLFTVR